MRHRARGRGRSHASLVGSAILPLIAACAGSDYVAGPTGSVQTIELSPASATVDIADSVRLAATARDGAGNAVAGRTISWSSSAPAVAGVSAAGTVTGVAAGTATITAAADGKSASATVTVSDPGPRVVLENGTAATATIGAAGGSIGATSTAGEHVTLIVPPGALLAPTRITVTPLASVRKPGLTGGVQGGVDLQPAGLRFARPARLRVELQGRPPAGQRVIAASFEGAARTLEPEPVTDSGNVAVVPVTHFSGAVLGFGTVADLQAMIAADRAASGASLTAVQAFTDSLLVLAADSTLSAATRGQLSQNVFLDWLSRRIVPDVQAAAGDSLLAVAVGEFEEWQEAALVLGVDVSGIDLSQSFRPAAAARIGAAIDGDNVVCANQQSFGALANVLFWADRAVELGVATAAFQLDRPAILRSLCVAVAAESDTLPDPLIVGSQVSLVTIFGVQFRNAPAAQGAAFAMTVLPATPPPIVTIANASGASNLQGLYTTVVTASDTGDASLVVQGCLILPGTTTPTDVCGQDTIPRTAENKLAVTSALPPALVGSSYGAPLNPVGGNGQYAFTLASGQLPPGLSLTGAKIAGSPQSAGIFAFVIHVVSGQQTTDAHLSIQIDNPPPPPPPPGNPPPPPGSSCPDVVVASSGHGSTSPTDTSLARLTCIDNLLIIDGSPNFKSLKEIQEALQVAPFGTTDSVSFPVLTSVGATLISGHKLTFLSMPALATVTGGLDIDSNDLLTSLSGVPCGIHVTGNLTINFNPQLSQSAAQAKVACEIVTGGTGTAQGNGLP